MSQRRLEAEQFVRDMRRAYPKADEFQVRKPQAGSSTPAEIQRQLDESNAQMRSLTAQQEIDRKARLAGSQNNSAK